MLDMTLQGMCLMPLDSFGQMMDFVDPWDVIALLGTCHATRAVAELANRDSYEKAQQWRMEEQVRLRQLDQQIALEYALGPRGCFRRAWDSEASSTPSPTW